ncbi:MAG: extracellular solute-binding protein [Clostridiales bacterium]|nr:extracellular solute-binding protein [Clostridiales bacterium]
MIISKIKKAFCTLLAAAVATVPLSITACAPRDEVLKIYNWGDYINEELLDKFEKWYLKETGENITVRYDTFDTNETMLTRIETQRADYDLVCPSDYIAERMIKEGLAQKVDPDIFDITEKGLFYDTLLEMIRDSIDEKNEYFTPYVWGTVGIMYDVDYIDPEGEFGKLCESWEAMWSDKWEKETGKKRVLMKDSVRDAYSVACIYANRDKLSEMTNGFTDYSSQEYRDELISYFSTVSDDSIALAQKALIDQKKVTYKYEVDDGKMDMVAGTTQAWLGVFWSCDPELIMIEDGGDHFYYTVPKEGSNVWVDGWLIPKYAKNTKAANYFLKFINTYDYAYANFDELGSSIAVVDVMNDAKAYFEEDKDGFFDDYYDGFKEMYIEMMFPSDEVLSRCAIMRDFGLKRNTDLDSMWIDVKTA